METVGRVSEGNMMRLRDLETKEIIEEPGKAGEVEIWCTSRMIGTDSP